MNRKTSGDERMSDPRNMSDEEKDRRRRAVSESLASVLQESAGTGPSPEVMELMNRYVDGEMTLEELGRRVRARYGIGS